MFEKDAEEFADSKSSFWRQGRTCIDSVKQAFQKGAEFAYNKANEWHYVRDGDVPKEGENVLCYCKGPGFMFCCVGNTIVGGDNKVRWWANNKSEKLQVIAWKDIVLPELKESE